MSYIFYPYFYGDESNWKDLFQKQEPADYIFQAFLQSGMARAIIPVREGFEYAVMWYMETGELWNGQDMIADTENELYVSIDEELRAPKIEVVEDTWETRLPTSLTIIQAQSAALDEGGLPCFCPDENTNIKPDEATLSGRNDTGGVGEFVVS
jgi:2-polyprenyl-6-methoxyphenol hydroxylase-like FAD-dependent oxidoreductase